MAPAPKLRLTRTRLAQAIVDGGSGLLEAVDQRYGHVRRLKAIYDDLIEDYASDLLRSGELLLIRRAAFLSLQCELLEASWAKQHLGKTPAPLGCKNLRLYTTAANALKRLMSTLDTLRKPLPHGSPPALRSGEPLTLEEMHTHLRARGLPMHFDPPVTIQPTLAAPTRSINGVRHGEAIH